MSLLSKSTCLFNFLTKFNVKSTSKLPQFSDIHLTSRTSNLNEDSYNIYPIYFATSLLAQASIKVTTISHPASNFKTRLNDVYGVVLKIKRQDDLSLLLFYNWQLLFKNELKGSGVTIKQRVSKYGSASFGCYDVRYLSVYKDTLLYQVTEALGFSLNYSALNLNKNSLKKAYLSAVQPRILF